MLDRGDSREPTWGDPIPRTPEGLGKEAAVSRSPAPPQSNQRPTMAPGTERCANECHSLCFYIKRHTR
jgi:hypothetical protein